MLFKIEDKCSDSQLFYILSVPPLVNRGWCSTLSTHAHTFFCNTRKQRHRFTHTHTHMQRSPFLVLSRKNGTARAPLTAQSAASPAKAVDERKIVLMQQGSCSFPIKPIKHMLPSFL